MTGIVMGMVLGLGLTFLTTGPGVPLALAVAALLGLARAARFRILALSAFLGSLMALHAIQDYQRLRADGHGEVRLLSGKVAGLPRRDERGGIRFRLLTRSCAQCDLTGRQMLLTWADGPDLAPGDVVIARIRLRTTRGLLNPGGFDFETWSFIEGVHGTGYVLSGTRWEGTATGLDRFRWRMSQSLIENFPEQGGLLAALAVGDRQGVSESQWEVLRITGTTHLLAISGMHISLVASLGGALGLMSFVLICRFCSVLARRDLALGLGLALGAVYAGLAGFSLPTQRAATMLWVGVSALWIRRRVQKGQVLALAGLAVLALEPAALLMPGFWMSFCAVAALMMAAGRGRGWRNGAWWRAQWAVFLALSPLLAGFGMGVSLLAPLVNLVAIPWLGVTVLPPLLLGSLIQEAVGVDAGLIDLSAWSLSLMFGVLEAVADLMPRFGQARPEPFATGLALLGAGLLLLPVGVPGRQAGWVALLAGCLGATGPVREPEIHVLDVGQGLAVLVRTGRHDVLYDTGPVSRSGWTAAESVIVPYLRSLGIRHLDLVVVSHGDADHAGGVAAINEGVRVHAWMSSTGDQGLQCRAGQSWVWEGVAFRVTHPTPGLPYLGNESSCVLEVRHGRSTFLLAGDIGEVIEGRQARVLQPVDGLSMPHHGSRTSSSTTWLQATSPALAVASVGFANRFGMPHPEVVDRHRAAGVQVAVTADCGRLVLGLVETGGLRWIDAAAHSQARRWRWPRPCARPSQTIIQKTSMMRGFQDTGE